MLSLTRCDDSMIDCLQNEMAKINLLQTPWNRFKMGVYTVRGEGSVESQIIDNKSLPPHSSPLKL